MREWGNRERRTGPLLSHGSEKLQAVEGRVGPCETLMGLLIGIMKSRLPFSQKDWEIEAHPNFRCWLEPIVNPFETKPWVFSARNFKRVGAVRDYISVLFEYL